MLNVMSIIYQNIEWLVQHYIDIDGFLLLLLPITFSHTNLGRSLLDKNNFSIIQQPNMIANSLLSVKC